MDKYHIDYWYENALEISKKYYWTTVGIVTRTESVESTFKRFAVYIEELILVIEDASIQFSLHIVKKISLAGNWI